MKQTVKEFFRRGLVACGFGPMVLAILYPVLQRHAGLESLTVEQVSTGIFSLWVLAFIAGGMNMVYQIERLPLMAAIAIHGGVLYVSYLVTYLVNSWLEWGTTPILVFSGIFVLGYLVVWCIIGTVTRKRTARINAMLKKQQGELR